MQVEMLLLSLCKDSTDGRLGNAVPMLRNVVVCCTKYMLVPIVLTYC